MASHITMGAGAENFTDVIPAGWTGQVGTSYEFAALLTLAQRPCLRTSIARGIRSLV